MKHIALIHPLHSPGIEEQIQPILEAEFSDFGLIEVSPDKGSIADAANWPFEKMAADQRRIFKEEIEPLLDAHPMAKVAYFGIAPIPLCVHLGFLLNMWKATARNRTQKELSWEWQGRGEGDAPFELIIDGMPDSAIPEKGKIVLMVATSDKVDEPDVEKIIPESILRVHIRLHTIGRDELKTEAEMMQVAQDFQAVLDRLRILCHPDCEVHLFAGIPAGLAFLLGTKIHSSSHHKVVTYKYVPDRKPPKHIRALTIGMHAPEPVRILFVASNPIETSHLDTEEEFGRMLMRIQGSWQAAHVEVETLFDASPLELVNKLITFKPTILHYAGHGTKGSSGGESRDLLLQNPSGQIAPRSGKDLAALLQIMHPPIQLLVLNACHSAGMMESLLPHVGCAIGMQAAIMDESAVLFAETLYLMLAMGNTVQAAFGAACFSMDGGGGMPSLRSQRNDPNELRFVG